MEFSVDTASLAGLPKLLDRLGDDARASRVYLRTHTDLGWAGEGLINALKGGHVAAVRKVQRFFETVEGQLAGRMSTNVQVAVNYYRRTDLSAAAALDATVPRAPAAGLPAMVGAGPGSFADRAEPQTCLVPPRDYSADFGLEQLFAPWFSPVGIARELIWKVTGLAVTLGILDRPIDPFIEFVRPFVGDWAGLRACAEVFERLGAASVYMGWNVHGGALSTHGSWNGNAADGCRNVLSRAEAALSGAESPLRELAQQYKDVAEKTHDIAGKVAGLLVEALDWAVIAMAEYTAAGLTAETVVGGVVFYGLAIMSITRCAEVLRDIATLVKAAAEIVLLADKSVHGFNIITPDVNLPGVPAAAPVLPDVSARKPI